MAIVMNESSHIQRDFIHALIDAGSKAPSPDNNQPWSFRQADEGLQILHARNRALPSDVMDLFSWIAIGAAIENVVLKASVFHRESSITYHPRPFSIHGGNEHVATIQFDGETSANPLAELIERRVTNRKLYDAKPLAESTIAVVSKVINNTNCRVDWLTEKRDRSALAQLIRIADRVRFESRSFHDEFHSVLRYGDEQALATRDGLEMKTLEVPAIAGPVFRFLRPWHRMKWANRFGLSRMFANVAAKQVKRSGALGLLSTSDQSDRGFLEAGRAFERIWLACTQADVAFQPLGALPLFLMKLQTEGDKSFSKSHAERLHVAMDSLRTLFPHAHHSGLIMMFRIGIAPPPTARSVRYETRSVITQ